MPDGDDPGGHQIAGNLPPTHSRHPFGLVRFGRWDDILVEKEDRLRYDEPPGWLIPLRHTLGGSLVANGRFAEAEKVYRDDLVRLPNDGWALYGLTQSLRNQGKHDEAARTEEHFRQVWAKADLEIHSSCLCQPGAPGQAH